MKGEVTFVPKIGFEELPLPDMLFLEVEDSLVPYFIMQANVENKNKIYLNLEDVDSMEKAQKLTGKRVFLPPELLPKLPDNQFHFEKVVGFEVIDKKHGLIGRVNNVFDNSAQQLLQVINNEKEILIPVADEIIQSVDRKKKTIYVTIPEGLLELYINS